MEFFESLPPAVALALGLFVLVWIVLLFLLPFMVENIRGTTRRIHAELEDLNDKIDRLNRLLADRGAPAYGSPEPRGREPERLSERAAPAAAPRARREPTISDLPPIEPAPPRRPNPAARR